MEIYFKLYLLAGFISLLIFHISARGDKPSSLTEWFVACAICLVFPPVGLFIAADIDSDAVIEFLLKVR